MHEHEGILAIRVLEAGDPVAAIKSLRQVTNLSLSEIRIAIRDKARVTIATLYRLDHDENKRIANNLFDELDKAGVEYEIVFENNVESRTFLNSALEHWEQISLQTEMMSDLESGEPDIETLQWLRRSSTSEVFQQTLKQVIASEGYNVDPVTREWATRMLDES